MKNMKHDKALKKAISSSSEDSTLKPNKKDRMIKFIQQHKRKSSHKYRGPLNPKNMSA